MRRRSSASAPDTLSASDQAGIRKWCNAYLQWLTHSKDGIDEREARNNHGTFWLMQMAAFAHLPGDQALAAAAGRDV